MGCEMGKIRDVMDKPVYLRQAVLDLGKIVMYRFHYNYMNLKYNVNLQFCYEDTNPLVYDIKTEGFYEDTSSNIKARFDTSGYSHKLVHPLPIGVNKKVISLMKDELGGRVMTEFVVLKLKLYAYRMLSGSGNRKCKGVKKCLVKRQ